jgi:uncharacterized protein
MKLQLREISNDEEQYQWEIPTQWVNKILQEQDEVDDEQQHLETLFKACGPLNLSVSLYRTQDEVLFKASLLGQLDMTCVRCLEQGSLAIELEFGGVFCQRASNDPPEPEDPAQFYYEHEEIDFSLPVRENFILHLPLHPLCTDECLGLCPNCGNNRNIEPCTCQKAPLDPRWEALRNLQVKPKSGVC